ncbi:MAG: ParA family protein [Bdellovibrionaceae bacterium]|nr:ParA family protein [Pseudobdellovibrionaceae bacterium]
MSSDSYNIRKAQHLFGHCLDPQALQRAEGRRLPEFARGSNGRALKSWSLQELPEVGQVIGFLRKPQRPLAAAVFVTKGGVLKTTLTLNLARMAALHNIRTCVVGLDMQCDISTALGLDQELDSSDSLSDALARVNSIRGLADVFTNESSLTDVIRSTDIPTLSFIPETPELTALDQSLMAKNRREYWLLEKVIQPLKSNFDLVLMDCAPNWNRLITNALVAADVLISPLECKINNFRNFHAFQRLIDEFRADLNVDFRHVCVPTRLSPSRKLSAEIYRWYRDHIETCIETAIRESVQGEEATAMRLSIPEYSPSSTAADEIREALREIWSAAGEKAQDLTKPLAAGDNHTTSEATGA